MASAQQARRPPAVTRPCTTNTRPTLTQPGRPASGRHDTARAISAPGVRHQCQVGRGQVLTGAVDALYYVDRIDRSGEELTVADLALVAASWRAYRACRAGGLG